MFGVCRRKREPEKTIADTFGEMFEQIDKDMQSSESRLLRLRTSHSSFTRSLVFYSLGIYGLILAFAYLYQADQRVFWQKLAKVGPIVAFPLVVFIIKRIADAGFARAIRKESIALTKLAKERDTKRQELESKTDWKKLQKLLGKSDPPPQPQPKGGRGGSGGSAAIDSKMPFNPMTGGGGTGGGGGGQPNTAYVPRTHDIVIPKVRGRADKFVDYILGDGPNNRYALICTKCFTHNGLARAEDVASIRYRCTYCQFLNGPPLPGQSAVPPTPSANKSGSGSGSGSGGGAAVPATPAPGKPERPPSRGAAETTDGSEPDPSAGSDNHGSGSGSSGSGSGSGADKAASVSAAKGAAVPPPSTPAPIGGPSAAPGGPPATGTSRYAAAGAPTFNGVSYTQMTPVVYKAMPPDRQVEYQKWFKEFKALVTATPRHAAASSGGANGTGAANGAAPPATPTTASATAAAAAIAAAGKETPAPAQAPSK